MQVADEGAFDLTPSPTGSVNQGVSIDAVPKPVKTKTKQYFI
jgi:hypothetical protein